jgi:hypothetical protein
MLSRDSGWVEYVSEEGLKEVMVGTVQHAAFKT